MILDEVKEKYVRDLLAKGVRVDGRNFLNYRNISIKRGVIQNAEGSAWVQLGNTQVLCGVKVDVMEPFADRPDEGVIVVNSEFSSMAHPDFIPGPPDERSIELARVVDRGIRSAEAIDSSVLKLPDGKVLGVFIDLYTLNHSGNLIDAAALAAMAALQETRIPKYVDGKLVRNDFVGKLKVLRNVVTTSVEKIDGQLFVDANDEEEIASDGRLTLATCDGDLICGGQKSGAAGFTKEEMVKIADIAIEKGRELRKLLG